MKTKVLFLLFFTFLCETIFAQGGALADLKFEEAEIAFNNQNYETTIKKLDEFDKTYGKITAKSLYLRIVCQNKLLIKDKIFESEEEFNLLLSLRKNVSIYIKAMESEELDDKFREIYKINEDLKIYPATIKDYKLAITKLNQSMIIDDYVKVQNSECMYFKDVKDKVIYFWEGACSNGFLSGYGVLTSYFIGTNVVYSRVEGNFSNGREEGNCTVTWYNGNKYEGNLKNGKRSGYGIVTGPNLKYEGNFENDFFDGFGKLTNSKNQIFEGQFKKGRTFSGRWYDKKSGQLIKEIINGQ
ncbi:hypothetical protein NAT47_08225 [Flavobacterium sp. HXWNR69]|uniref:MORN repeat-containing protein n=1 Tax=Flavobacterium fragile TaxID=2949085 RepID=A0ABT0TIH1_9FLAO|nr:hypothetical protein [Flavobacterium sp. HXWNR69]MCL9770401.1 hypothetical protein [Flavobacterium sp. HXWNR69]